MTYKLLEAWKSQPGAEYTLEEVLDEVCEYVKDDVPSLTTAIVSARGLTQLPGTSFYVLPVEGGGSSMKAGIIQQLQKLAPETYNQNAPELTDAQVAHAVSLVFGELEELRSMVENIRKQAEDSPRLTFYREKVTQIVSGKEVTP